jgi:thymidylate synthase (FAD)
MTEINITSNNQQGGAVVGQTLGFYGASPVAVGAAALREKYFPVLDHGFVALLDYMGGDIDIVKAARVSYGAGTKKKMSDRSLLRYLLNHNHTSPFEMVELKFHVRLPIFVARQLIRHRTANVNEYSLRYSMPSMQFYMPQDELMGQQNKKNKQGRAEPVMKEQALYIKSAWTRLQEGSSELYEAMVDPDVDLARELARMHLPLSLYTEWYWKIDLHNLFHFLKLRADAHAQEEIQAFARVKAGIAKIVAPLAYEAWIDYSYCARKFSRLELIALEERLRTGKMDQDRLRALGLSEREVADFWTKTSGGPPLPNFELDLNAAKTSEYFYELFQADVPRVDLEGST